MRIIKNTTDEISFKTDDQSRLAVGMVILIPGLALMALSGILCVFTLINSPKEPLVPFLFLAGSMVMTLFGWVFFDHPTTVVTVRRNQGLGIERTYRFNRKKVEDYSSQQIESIKLFEVKDDTPISSHILKIVFGPRTGLDALYIENFGYLSDEERLTVEDHIKNLNILLKPQS